MMKKILLLLLFALLIIQFFQISSTNEDTRAELDLIAMEKPSGDLGSLLRSACYDCHSEQTVYPGYTKIQPVGWWVRGHVRGGKQKLNFSKWGDYTDKQRIHHGEESVEVLNEGRMPLKSYTWLHPQSKLSAEEKESLVAFFSAL